MLLGHLALHSACGRLTVSCLSLVHLFGGNRRQGVAYWAGSGRAPYCRIAEYKTLVVSVSSPFVLSEITSAVRDKYIHGSIALSDHSLRTQSLRHLTASMKRDTRIPRTGPCARTNAIMNMNGIGNHSTRYNTCKNDQQRPANDYET